MRRTRPPSPCCAGERDFAFAPQPSTLNEPLRRSGKHEAPCALLASLALSGRLRTTHSRRASRHEWIAVLMSAVPTFADLGVAPELVAALKRGGIEAPFPIQVATLPDAIAGRDILGRGPDRLRQDPRLRPRPAHPPRRPPRAAQAPARPRPRAHPRARDAGQRRARARWRTRSACSVRLIVGGMPYSKQIRSLERGVDVLVATPGPPRRPDPPRRRRPVRDGRSPSSTRPTRWPTWASCRSSARCST